MIERKRLSRDPCDVRLQERVKLARQGFELAKQRHADKECKELFSSMSTIHPRKRTSMTYKYVRKFKRMKRSSSTDKMHISQWENILKIACEGREPQPVLEDDYWPSDAPPGTDEIHGIIKKMHNGTSPGLDDINIELIKASPPELLELIRSSLEAAWLTNIVPSEWLNTRQFPIPKIPHPKDVNDFRRIALSNAVYKIYASFLLMRLDF